MKNLTDFRKTVETGVDPGLVRKYRTGRGKRQVNDYETCESDE